jgi:hypothetical protein
MLTWLLAAAVGITVAVVAYGWREPRRIPERAVPALVRALALTALIAALLAAPLGRARPPVPWVALDVSTSWLRGGDSSAWRSARDRARAEAGDSILLFGDSVRIGPAPDLPTDRASRIRPAAGRALAAGRPLLALTDGLVDDPTALVSLPGGSRVDVRLPPQRPDAALTVMELPRSHTRGDTLETQVTIAAGSAGGPGGRLALLIGDARLAEVAVEPLPAGGERTIVVRAALEHGDGPVIVRAVFSAAGDVEPRNDTLAAVIDVSEAAGAIFISTAPDFDARYAVGVLRGALSLPTRAYYRVAPGQWRIDGTLTRVTEAEIRRAVRAAPLVVFHGDTSIFGPPQSSTQGALALIAPVTERGDWYAVGAPASPLTPALSGIAWDSLAPLDVATRLPGGDWEGLETLRARQFERRPAIVGTERPRRRVIVGAAGLWRWQFRGGTSADAYSALWGSIFDWLLDDASAPRSVAVADPLVRAGEPIRWRRGTTADTAITIVLSRRDAPGSVDSLTLQFATGVSIAESPSLASGMYDVRSPGGRTILAVNPSREWLPRPPTVATGAIGQGATANEPARARTLPWIYAAAIILLCVEWVVRRRRGWR